MNPSSFLSLSASVNYLAVLAAALAGIVIGTIWFGPLFGKLFLKEKGMERWTKQKRQKMKEGMRVNYFAQFIVSFVMFYVLARLISGFDKGTLAGGTFVGFVMWLGFVVPLALGEAIWGGTLSLFWLNVGHMLVTLLAAGAILGVWR